jgi:hypothetical protein
MSSLCRKNSPEKHHWPHTSRENAELLLKRCYPTWATARVHAISGLQNNTATILNALQVRSQNHISDPTQPCPGLRVDNSPAVAEALRLGSGVRMVARSGWRRKGGQAGSAPQSRGREVMPLEMERKRGVAGDLSGTPDTHDPHSAGVPPCVAGRRLGVELVKQGGLRGTARSQGQKSSSCQHGHLASSAHLQDGE